MNSSDDVNIETVDGKIDENTDIAEFYKVIRDDKKIYALTTFKRAIPYFKDGLILVYRRILFDMLKSKYTYDGETHKSAKVVGDIIGNLHPHGDASVYNAIVTQSQPWTNNYPLVYGQGNWGNVLGDSAAAYRYTECKLSKFFGDIIEDISPTVVNYEPNFDNSTKEVEYLPFKIPILLLNGSYGIAESYITSVPPHNLIDLANLCERYIRNRNIPNDVLVDGFYPDCPYYGIVTNKSELERVYKYGEPGNMKMKSNLEIDRVNNKIIIKDLPYGMTRKNITDVLRKKNAEKDPIMSKVLDLINIKTKKDDGSNYIEFEVVFDKNSNILEIAKNIERFCTTKTIPLNFILNYGDYVKNVNIKEIVAQWYNILSSTKLRKYSSQISTIQTRKYTLEGVLAIYDYIDDVIKYIKTSESKAQIIEYLSTRYKLSNIQAKAISEMQLYTLSRVSKDSLIQNIKDLNDKIIMLNEKLNLVDIEIIDDLEFLKQKYGRPRRTLVIDEDKTNENKKIIPMSNGSLLYSHNQYAIFDIQNIVNGKTLMNGLKTVKIDGKNVKEICGCNNITSDIIGILLFTTDGKVRRIEATDIIDLNNWIPMDSEDVMIKNIIPVTSNDEKLIVITKDNKIKITPIDSIGKMAVNFGDFKVLEKLEESTTDIFMITESGKYQLLNIQNIPELSRTASGNMISTDEENIYICQVIYPSDYDFICTVKDSEMYNYILRIELSKLEESNRNNKFKSLINLGDGFKVTNVNKIDMKRKESKCIMIGKYSSSQLSIQTIKSNDMLSIPKRVPVETIGVVQYEL